MTSGFIAPGMRSSASAEEATRSISWGSSSQKRRRTARAGADGGLGRGRGEGSRRNLRVAFPTLGLPLKPRNPSRLT